MTVTDLKLLILNALISKELMKIYSDVLLSQFI